jgi:hypothetical protein
MRTILAEWESYLACLEDLNEIQIGSLKIKQLVGKRSWFGSGLWYGQGGCGAEDSTTFKQVEEVEEA